MLYVLCRCVWTGAARFLACITQCEADVYTLAIRLAIRVGTCVLSWSRWPSVPTDSSGFVFRTRVDYTAPTYHRAGAAVVLTGLQRTEFNGRRGNLGPLSADRRRVRVTLATGEQL